VNLAPGGRQPVTIGVARQGGFSAAVNVTLSLPSGVSATPAGLAISGASASGTMTLVASATAAAGSFTASANGSASGAPAAQKSFKVNIAGLPSPHVTAVTPSVQQKGGTITVAGTGFDANCSLNTLSFAGVGAVLPTACGAGSLTVTVPAQAAYGPTTLKVTSGGRPSNDVAFSVGRQAGSFAEITSDVLHQHTTRTCGGGTAKVDVAPSGTAYVASYRKLPGNSLIGTTITFQPDFWYRDNSGTKYTIANIGGAGFSLCSAGLVFDGGNGSPARLFLRDLDRAADFQASPYTVPIQEPRLTPPYSENYEPRFFASPDGTILLVVSAAPASGTGNVTAAFFDRVAGGTILKSVSITKPASSATVGNPAITVTLGADNRITLVFGTQTFGPFAVP
jgi:hypothetical protein